jgi:hypothetical protein
MRLTPILLALATLLVAEPAVAGRSVAPINVDRKGLALHGYDPVTYFESDKPPPGSVRGLLREGGEELAGTDGVRLSSPHRLALQGLSLLLRNVYTRSPVTARNLGTSSSHTMLVLSLEKMSATPTRS